MNYTFRYEPILSLKEREKDQAKQAYHKAVGQFERVAAQLFELLKQKEKLEKNQEKSMITGMNVVEVKQYQHYRTNLEKLIMSSQKQVSVARQSMDVKQFELLKSDQEVKKYFKLKEKGFINHQQLEKTAESKGMDEVAIRQFTNWKSR